jgi:flagellar assembly factor FliW
MRSSPEGREPARRRPQLIQFPLGLPGFPHATRFTLQPAVFRPGPLLILRSADDPSVRFLVLPCADDALPIDRAELQAACDLHGLSLAQVAVLLIVSSQPGGTTAAGDGLCANRRAPILLDTGRAIGVQHVLDNPDYAVRWPLALAA